MNAICSCNIVHKNMLFIMKLILIQNKSLFVDTLHYPGTVMEMLLRVHSINETKQNMNHVIFLCENMVMKGIVYVLPLIF